MSEMKADAKAVDKTSPSKIQVNVENAQSERESSDLDGKKVVNTVMAEALNPTSPPPQAVEPPVKTNQGLSHDGGLLSDQIIGMMRQEALLHLEYAWNAQKKLALLCAEDDVQVGED